MTRGNQRDKDRERAQARAAKNAKTGNSCSGQAKLDQADIMRQKQAAAEAKKAAEAAGGVVQQEKPKKKPIMMTAEQARKPNKPGTKKK